MQVLCASRESRDRANGTRFFHQGQSTLRSPAHGAKTRNPAVQLSQKGGLGLDTGVPGGSSYLLNCAEVGGPGRGPGAVAFTNRYGSI